MTTEAELISAAATRLKKIAEKRKRGRKLTEEELRFLEGEDESGAKRLGVTSSIATAAARMGVPPEILKRAKRAGCQAFTGSGRVDCDAARKWIAEHGQDLLDGTGESKRDQKLSEEIRKLRRLNDEAEGRLVARSAIVASISRILPQVDRILEQRLCNEYPTAVAGLDVPQARVFGKRLADEIRRDMGKLATEWPE